MVAYAVGEMSRQVPVTGDSDEGNIISEENLQPTSSSSSSNNVTRSINRMPSSSTVVRQRRQKPAAATDTCYEVVTAWVHPR